MLKFITHQATEVAFAHLLVAIVLTGIAVLACAFWAR